MTTARGPAIDDTVRRPAADDQPPQDAATNGQGGKAGSDAAGATQQNEEFSWSAISYKARKEGLIGATAFVGGIILLVIAAVTGLVWFISFLAGDTYVGAKWTFIGSFAAGSVALLTVIYRGVVAINSELDARQSDRRVSALLNRELDEDTKERIKANRHALQAWEDMVVAQARTTNRYSLIAMGAGLAVVCV
jgi:hypothetical protein